MEDASRKQNDVAEEMNKTLKKLEEKEGECNLYPQITILCNHIIYVDFFVYCFPRHVVL